MALGTIENTVRKGKIALFEDLTMQSFENCFTSSSSKEQLPNSYGFSQRLLITPDDLVEIFERVPNLNSGADILKLFLGREEKKLLHSNSIYPDYVTLWNNSKKRRVISPEEILSFSSTSNFVKELFNCFFRDEVYGKLYSINNIIMSGGSSSEILYGIPNVLKQCLHYSLERNWYGYSSSLGRESVREAVARLESSILKTHIPPSKIAITMGATATFASLFDFISLSKETKTKQPRSYCVIPNYPPIVEAASQRLNLELVPCDYGSEQNTLSVLISKIANDTPVVILQTAINPSGRRISEDDIEKLIYACSPTTIIILDECHEILNCQPNTQISIARNNSNVVRVKSISKDFSSPGLKVGWFISSEDFIENYYEYASTNYGSTPSLFYLLTEVLARFERFYIENSIELTGQHISEFDDNYCLSLTNLNSAYSQYIHYRKKREIELMSNRIMITNSLVDAKIKAIQADYSVNITCLSEKYDSSYAIYRDILSRVGVCVYPGILTFDFSNPVFRISPLISERMGEGINNLIEFSS